MKKPKIVYIFKSIVNLAGMERILSQKMNYLVETDKYDVFFITYEQSGMPLSFNLSNKITHINLDINFYKQYHKNLLKRIQIIIQKRHFFSEQLKNVLNEIKPNIVICTNYDYLLARNIYKAYPTAKHIMESHVYKQSEMTFGQKNKFLRFFGKIYDQHIEYYIRKFDVIVTLSEQEKLNWSHNKNVFVIPNLIQYPKEVSKKEKTNRIISVGRLEYQKGYDILIKVWSKIANLYPNWSISIYGAGHEKDYLVSLIKKYRIENSFFIFPPTDNIMKIYPQYDFYVMSSRFEGFGIVLIEAMANGLPCIAFDCPSGPSEIIKDSEDGYLVECFNENDFAKKISTLINDTDKRQKMGKSAREHALVYDEPNVMEKWLDIFSNILK